MSVRATLIAGFAGVFLPIGVLSVIALTTLSAANTHTHELYQNRLVAAVTLSQTVENLDQMRQMVMQYALTTGSHVSIGRQQRAIRAQLAILDMAIDQTIAAYGRDARTPQQQAVLRGWPAAWQAFLLARTALLQRSAGAPSPRQDVLHLLTVTLSDRLNTVLDLVYVLTGAEQRLGYTLDQTQQQAYQRTLALLIGGMALVVGVSVALASTLTHSVTRLYEEAATRAARDGLTGLLNHRAFLERLDAATAHGQTPPSALLLLDVDNFKLFNDTYGHPAGDAVLCGVAALLRASCREGDVLARNGGDEFAMLLPGATETDVHTVTQRLDTLVQATPYRTPDGALIPLRLSIGSACCPREGRTRQELVAVADAAMYNSKRQRVSSSSPIPAGLTTNMRHLHLHDAADLLGDSPFGVLAGLVSAVDAKDAYTREHSEDVTRLALLLADALDLPAEQRRSLAVAGPLHDVGKIAVPDRILRKPGRLTDEEYDAIKRHVIYGVAIISGVLQDAAVIDAIACHHERWDGRGYPHGLVGPETSVLGRIMQVADAVSAMSLDRPYRRGLPWSQVVDALRAGAGTQFDPALVEPFITAVQGRRQDRAAS